MDLQVDRFDEVPVDDIIVDRFQVRTTNVGDGIDELAASIEQFGLLHPVILCVSARDEKKWEVVCGQRRLLAHKTLGRNTIAAGIFERVLSPEEGEAVSANENIHQLAMSRPDLVDLCERLYLRYGTLQAVADKTKIPYHVVRKYVRLARLDEDIKEMVKNREIELDLAVKAQDAASATGTFKKDEAMELIEVLKKSDNELRKRIIDVKKENPTMDMDSVAKKAEEPPEDLRISFRVYRGYADALRRVAAERGADTNTVAQDLLEEALESQGLTETDT